MVAPKTRSTTGAILLRGMALIAVLAAGGAAAKYIMAIERPLPKGAHGHGPAEKGKEAHGHKNEKGGHDGHDHGPEKMSVKLNPTQLKNARLTIEPATDGTIRESIVLNGIVQPNEEQVAAVLPRFGGVVRAVSKRLGEPVRKGEVVAKIESNESLTQYDIVAPIGGTVIERKGVLGEYADKDKRLMVIADLSTLWVDFRVYQQDFPKLKLGQSVEIALNGARRTAQISYISPIGMTDTQSMLARAVIDNKDGAFRPGLYVTGRVLIAEQSVPIAVKQSAIQHVNGKPVVFVEMKEGFEAREVEFGLKDDELIEIIFGVVAGDKVVTGNSFVLKAEIGKGEATHEH
jgi:cobalt-zinc-cadmium efflux system membrane fusion protein